MRRFGIPDSGFASRLLVQRSTLHHFNALNEIFHHFNQPLHFCRFNTLALDCFGQTAPAGRFPEPLEKYEMAAGSLHLPAGEFAANDLAVRRLHQLPGERGREGNNIVGDAANEPSISVDPTDGNKIAIGWRQFNT